MERLRAHLTHAHSFCGQCQQFARALSADRLAGDAGTGRTKPDALARDFERLDSLLLRSLDVTDGLYLAVQMTAKEQDRLRAALEQARLELIQDVDPDAIVAGIDAALAEPAPGEAGEP